ncbi:hypothetical protein BCR32DRAFT_272860 [Anaeromyces robustus]|uniref:Carbohydrate esterase 2 N-terminal domain-containing protein n=1 Tax=Anaeromyces robustus TaxID=1754192 RepID=A0A1Y1VUT7_9FUNG|nr:hypothetical protein BCR32DRAFT_272860 [Anaeromyces robustus]|eukprot:ORX65061.1 hypothetical protein BCR32DRAFT_272860 [Anaeromyces robustus]
MKLMKIKNLILLAGLSSLTSALPKINNPYLVCSYNDYECKGHQTELCYREVGQCWRINYLNYMKCIRLNDLCSEIWSSNSNESMFNTFEPTKNNVKIIGRAKYIDGSLWVGQTDSGIEFKINGKTATIVVSTDSIYGSLNKETPARLFVYGDNELGLDHLTSSETEEITIEFDEIGEHTIRLLKVSECQMGSIYIDEIKTDSEFILPTAPKSRKIEFIGDSIVCAYGAMDTEGDFTTTTEDGTKSFGYKVAQKFNADYSIFGFSGWGVYSGFNMMGIRNTDLLIPPIYDKLGFLNWNIEHPENTTIAMSNVNWGNNEFEPDLIVINLGTNDETYIDTISNAKTQIAEKINFTNAYKDFIAQIRSIHPNSEILCTLGIMGQNLYPEIENAVNEYVNETNDNKVNAYKLNVQDVEKNGIGILTHPNALSQVDAANEIIDRIETLYGWTPDSNIDISEN